jgi:hypothetical protein
MRKVKSLKELINILIDDGYKPDLHGDWTKRKAKTFQSRMFKMCETELDKDEETEWREKWLDTVIKYPCLMKNEETNVIVLVKNQQGDSVIVETNLRTPVSYIVYPDLKNYKLFAEINLVEEIKDEES